MRRKKYIICVVGTDGLVTEAVIKSRPSKLLKAMNRFCNPKVHDIYAIDFLTDESLLHVVLLCNE